MKLFKHFQMPTLMANSIWGISFIIIGQPTSNYFAVDLETKSLSILELIRSNVARSITEKGCECKIDKSRRHRLLRFFILRVLQVTESDCPAAAAALLHRWPTI